MKRSMEEQQTDHKKVKSPNYFESLTTDLIKTLCSSETFARGTAIFNKNQVFIDVLDSNHDINANCFENKESIQISISLSKNGEFVNPNCSQHGKKMCEHSIATLLSFIDRKVLLSPLNSPVVEQFGEMQWKERNDRQLRLWGLHGQQRIDQSNVLLLNASVVGSEVLKNIVLPGFGNFAIVDDKMVSIRDLGKNFYVTVDSLGSSIAKSVCENLAELNPDNVQGNYLVENPMMIIDEQPQFLDSYNFVIASNMNTKSVEKLAKLCWAKNKTLMVCRSYGMIGYIRTVVPRHEVVEGKLDSNLVDLRITQPWPELHEFCQSFDFEKMPFKDHCHVPYIVILIKFLEVFRSKYKKLYPETVQEQTVFEQWLKEEEKRALDRRQMEIIDENDEFSSQLSSQNGEENFDEARTNVFQAWMTPEIPDTVLEIIHHPLANEKLDKHSSTFWFLCAALREFIKTYGVIPLNGKIPDMTSDTEKFVHLQNIYRNKSKHDMNMLKKILTQILGQYSLVGKVSDYDIKEFCTNINQIRYFESKSLDHEYNPSKINMELIRNELSNETSNMIHYVMLRASDMFYETHHHYPGEDLNGDYQKDAQELEIHVKSFLTTHQVDETAFDISAYSLEMSRFGASELHNISSLVGGVAAQELIKLCTKQRLPLVNTWIFDGARGVSSCFDL